VCERALERVCERALKSVCERWESVKTLSNALSHTESVKTLSNALSHTLFIVEFVCDVGESECEGVCECGVK